MRAESVLGGLQLSADKEDRFIIETYGVSGGRSIRVGRGWVYCPGFKGKRPSYREQ